MKSFHLLLVCLIISTFGAAQTVDPQLSDDFQDTLDLMQQVLNINGLGAAVQLSNDAVWAGGSGVSTFTPLDNISPGHRFASGSTTKTITAACILQLVDEGMLSLDDNIGLWAPNFNYVDPNITVRQLLRHESGIYNFTDHPNFNSAMFNNPARIWTFEEVMDTFIEPPLFLPGQDWSYSNTNYLLLGLIIQEITGKSYLQEVRDRFFSPLGLNSYSNPAYDPLPYPAAHVWLDINGDGVLDDAFTWLTDLKSIFSAVDPAGGYYTTPSDLSKWIRTSMNGSLFSTETWSEATETVPTTFSGGAEYGLGLIKREYLGIEAYGHGGDLAGYSTAAFYFPEKDISIVVNGNQGGIYSIHLNSTVEALLQVYLDYEISLSVDSYAFEKDNILVFPNPFTNEIHLQFNSGLHIDDVTFNMTDISGKIIWKSEIESNSLQIGQAVTLENLASLNSGIFFLNMYSDSQFVKTFKVVKN